MTGTDVVELATPRGIARVHLHRVPVPRALIVLGHGAGGGVDAPDLVAVTGTALGAGLSVALVEQPYRVAGRRAPDRAPALDVAWTVIVAALRQALPADTPVIAGGRSSGARVACRTSQDTGVAAVLCLAFPLQPPGRSGAAAKPSRLPELDAVTVPVLVVQGERDPFGMPPDGPGRLVARVPGDHSLRAGVAGVREAVAEWLTRVVPAG